MEYVVRFSELNEDTETYEFFLEDTFFQRFQNSDWEGGKIKAVVVVSKRPDGITLDLDLSGELAVTCDRCLDTFLLPVETSEQLFVKFGNEAEELDDDVMVISREENKIDLAGLFYDFLVLSIPVRRVHPANSDGSSGCDPEMIRKLDQHIVHEDEEKSDPRWDELKKLKNKN